MNEETEDFLLEKIDVMLEQSISTIFCGKPQSLEALTDAIFDIKNNAKALGLTSGTCFKAFYTWPISDNTSILGTMFHILTEIGHISDDCIEYDNSNDVELKGRLAEFFVTLDVEIMTDKTLKVEDVVTMLEILRG